MPLFSDTESSNPVMSHDVPVKTRECIKQAGIWKAMRHKMDKIQYSIKHIYII